METQPTDQISHRPMSDLVDLEPIAPHHADEVQPLASHPDVVATTNLPDPYPDDGAEQWIENLLSKREAGTEYAFAVRNQEGELVGVTGLVDVTGESAELGFWIGKPFWDRGYATAAARKTLDVAFGELGVDRVEARALRRNAPSRRVLQKLEFVEGAVETHEHPKWGEDDLVVRSHLSRAQWRVQGR